uniref:Uncharacterized protein n=1 Tax=Arundo donax TaxID=35708 RepID=A0A0A9BVD8_ARUDO
MRLNTALQTLIIPRMASNHGPARNINDNLQGKIID